MNTERYTSVAGEVIEYPTPSPERAAFLRRAMDATNDPRVSEAALLELVYGRENPILDQTIFPARGAVTKAVMADPLYAILTDLLQQKAVLSGSFVEERDAKPYTLTVLEAADRIGVSADAVRKAIRGDKLAAHRGEAGEYKLAPHDVDVYRDRVPPRGAAAPRPAVTPLPDRPLSAPALTVRCGSVEGRSLRFKVLDTVVNRRGKHGAIVDLEIPLFERAVIATSSTKTNHTFSILPGPDAVRFEWGPFYVEGRFQIVDVERDAKRAHETFRDFAVARGLDDKDRLELQDVVHDVFFHDGSVLVDNEPGNKVRAAVIAKAQRKAQHR